jgi:outer membrane scaffolding protein for murein synthesis (MipA/OmpV family)
VGESFGAEQLHLLRNPVNFCLLGTFLKSRTLRVRIRNRGAGSIFLGILLCGHTLFAQISKNFNGENLPKFEWGLGFVAAEIPSYPGAKRKVLRALPFPWFVYRGEILRMDEEGRRARLKVSSRYELGISGGFNFPVESAVEGARRGMPDLDALMSIGPSLIFRPLREERVHQLNIKIGFRAAFSSDFSSRFLAQGMVLEPSVVYWRQITADTTFYTRLSALIGDSHYNGFFYDVPKSYATESRGHFRSRAGLSEIVTGIGASHYLGKRFQFFLGGFWSNQSLAQNKNSPLVEEEHTFSLALGFIWRIMESHAKVQPDQDAGS